MNGAGVDITGKVVVLRASFHREGLRAARELLFRAEGGFGCEPDTIGTCVVGTYLADGEHCRIEGPVVERVATARDLMEAFGSPRR